MSKYCQVVTTLDSKGKAEEIAREVVSRRLAACAQVIGPIFSYYWWKGRVERSEEWLCVMKSRLDVYPNLEKFLLERHPYELPEIVATPYSRGS